MRILIAEDDAALASFVKKGLEAEHYAADVSADGEQSRAMATEFDYDLLVLDLNMPRLDGVSILRYLRTKKPSVPVLILTGRSRVEDRVQCLDLGADDYLVKPFSFAELSARIRALLRRSHLPAESVLAVDDLKLDRVERRVERGGRRIELTSKEFALLEYLMRNAGRRITRAMIIEHVWNLSFDTCTNVVDVYVIMLGCKLEPLVNMNSTTLEFTAMVGLAGQLCGVVTMRSTAKSAVLMASKMLGIDPKDADQQTWDAIGEVANMIAGNFKNKLTGLGDKCMLSVPTVITGGDYSFHSLADGGPMEVMFLFEGAPVLVSLEVHS